MNKKIAMLIMTLTMPLMAMASEKNVTGKLVDMVFNDDARISVRPDHGKLVEAYCYGKCGDWFTQSADGETMHLKRSLIGKTVTLRYADERNGDRIAGPGDDSIETFVKAITLSK